MAGVLDGQPVDAAVTNPAFIIKNADDTTPSRLGLGSAAPDQGPAITWTQQEVNSIDSFIGKTQNIAATATPPWTHNDIGLSTDPLFTRVNLMTAKFNGITGHMHTGVDGDGPILNGSNITGNIVNTITPAGFPSLVGNVQLSPGTGVSFAVSGQIITITASGSGTVESIAVTGYPAATGNIIFEAGTGIGLSQSGDLITISASASGGYKAPTIQTFGPSAGTYTTPTSPSPLYLKVTVVGDGGGGGSEGPSGSAGTVGSGTSFGPISCGAGNPGTGNYSGGAGAAGGTGGTNTISAGPLVLTNVQGGQGSPTPAYISASGAVGIAGGDGGSNPMGGGGAGGYPEGSGSNASANTGGGGGGSGYYGGGASAYPGSGGGAGGYVEAIINSPASTYAYSVGSGGTGASGGGNGGSGYIIVEEHYQ
jgi:hypothetical protein